MITDISVKSITITAADGSVKNIARSQFILIDASTKIKEIKLIMRYISSLWSVSY
jgi:hypothetical protein